MAWKEFLKGKRNKKDVQEFQLRLMDNVLMLHKDLAQRTYEHGEYYAFNISDPKPRNIHKASVRDRLLHHAIYRVLYPSFDKTFVADSYSCRRWKGTHRAVDRFRRFFYKVSKNDTKTCWVLKCDVRKFFASIDQTILLEIVSTYIQDKDIVWLLSQVMKSFHSTKEGIGLPLGNLTSQLLVNIYMNEFDQFVKRGLKVKYYIRYADDFVILSHDRECLENVLLRMQKFLLGELKLHLHPDKVFIKSFASGVDFLGWVHYPDHRIMRTVSKRRMFRRIRGMDRKVETVQSYLGLLSHGNTHKLQEGVRKIATTEPL